MNAREPKLHLAEGLDIGLDAVTQTFAFIARRGAGKTYGASKLAEEMLGAGSQIIIIEPIGNWYALRLGADGRSKGFDIVVLGGLHGDLPLDPSSGALVANLLVDRGISAVLDVSMMRKGDRKRFAAEFAEQLFARKKEKRSPLHLFLEEAQVFVPQRVQPDDARMLGAFEDLVKLGRNFGIGCTLISQRPQAVNKDVLNQTECLVVLQTNGAQERKALKEWIVEAGLDVGTDLIATLPGLERGEAWVWSPSWLRLTKRVRIAKKRTLNASATPEHGAVVEAKPLAPIDLAHLKEAMAETMKAAAASDPKTLQKRITELERQLAAKPAAPAVAKVETKVVEKPVIAEQHVKRLARDVAMVETIAHSLSAEVKALRDVVQPIAAGLAALRAPAPIVRQNIPARSTERSAPVAGKNIPDRIPAGDVRLGRCEIAILNALAVRRPHRLTRAQLALISGYSGESGGFANALGKLRSTGFIETGTDGLTALSTAGESHVTATTPRGPQEVYDHWRGQLGKCERELMRVLAETFPTAVTRADLAERSGYSADSGGFANALGRLRTLTLAVNDAGGIRASDEIGGAR